MGEGPATLVVCLCQRSLARREDGQHERPEPASRPGPPRRAKLTALHSCLSLSVPDLGLDFRQFCHRWLAPSSCFHPGSRMDTPQGLRVMTPPPNTQSSQRAVLAVDSTATATVFSSYDETISLRTGHAAATSPPPPPPANRLPALSPGLPMGKSGVDPSAVAAGDSSSASTATEIDEARLVG